tara:strand:+ start:5980 stop:6288 length:309 start_codon:yes stop_codon:yes gene_type:complete
MEEQLNHDLRVIDDFFENASEKEIKDVFRKAMISKGTTDTLEILSLFDKQTSITLDRAVNVLDDYLNAGDKKQRAEAAEKAKQVYEEYYGEVYLNRNERKKA